jgi:anti-anti-sigma regulatory factor
VDIPGLDVELLEGERIAVFTVSGGIPEDYHSEVSELVISLTARGYRGFVGDCSRAERITGTGVGIMAYHVQRLRENGGEVALVRAPEGVMRAVPVVDLDSFVALFSGREQALEHVRAAISKRPMATSES